MMTADFVAIGGFAVLFILLLARVPIGVAMGMVGIGGFGILAAWNPALNLLAISPIRTVTGLFARAHPHVHSHGCRGLGLRHEQRALPCRKRFHGTP